MEREGERDRITHGQVPPLRTILERPQPPRLAQIRRIILRLVLRAKTLLDRVIPTTGAHHVLHQPQPTTHAKSVNNPSMR